MQQVDDPKPALTIDTSKWLAFDKSESENSMLRIRRAGKDQYKRSEGTIYYDREMQRKIKLRNITVIG
jgi:hypothetical protein